MNIQLIQVPYDSGHRGVRMGYGPAYFVQHGIAEQLQRHGWTVAVECIEAQRPFNAEIFTAYELHVLSFNYGQRHKKELAYAQRYPGVVGSVTKADVGFIHP